MALPIEVVRLGGFPALVRRIQFADLFYGGVQWCELFDVARNEAADDLDVHNSAEETKRIMRIAGAPRAQC
jgi:hypothetical protein